MKNYFSQLLILAVLLFVGCSDPCKDVDCNLGTCDDGTCICTEGYEGTFCETLEVEKYLGEYKVTEESCSDGTTSDLETLTIAIRPGGTPFDITGSLSDEDVSFSFDGTLKDGVFSVIGEIDGFQITLEGIISGSTFTGKIDISGIVSCDYTMEKQ